jgi:DNA-binding CsgD family transcriptional regulator
LAPIAAELLPPESHPLVSPEPEQDPHAVPDPYDVVVAAEFKARLADGMRSLSDREKFVLWLRYHDGLRLHEIGDVLGVTESRISQIHSTAVRRFRGERDPASPPREPRKPRRRRPVEACPLSTREFEVLRGLARGLGLAYEQIAAELDLSTSTVRTHLHNVYVKLGARDRAQAVLIAVKCRWWGWRPATQRWEEASSS